MEALAYRMCQDSFNPWGIENPWDMCHFEEPPSCFDALLIIALILRRGS